MEPIIFTRRLKLTLITKAERGSQELAWIHELRSDEKATFWSIYGRSKTIEDTEKVMKGGLPNDEGLEKTYRVTYAVHEIIDPVVDSANNTMQTTYGEKKSTRFVGLVSLIGMEPGNLELPEDLTLPLAAANTTLTAELAYAFLPIGWHKGYATESVKAVLESCKRSPSFWAPFPKLYVRVIVNDGNPASLRVMEKVGMTKRGIYNWTGKSLFLGGEWTDWSKLHIFGLHLLE